MFCIKSVCNAHIYILDNVPVAKEEKRTEPPPPAVKRSPSLNESHYGSSAKTRLGTDPVEVFNQLERRQTRMETVKPSVETQTPGTAASRNLNVTPPVQSRGQTEPGSFTRTGSGRKLPQIPDRSRSNTLPTRKEEPEKEVMEENSKLAEEETQRKQSKPKAMEFWESMENIERNDFRYNTIHRMSMGRRLLPKPPDAAGAAAPSPHARSQSVDRSESSTAEVEKLSLNSSFSGPTSLPQLQKSSDNDSTASHSPRSFHKIPADGASLQSQNSETGGAEISLDLRREAEGSSNNNSPPTSVIQGVGEDPQNVWELAKPNQNPAYDWIRGSFDRSSDNGRRKWSLPSPVTAIGQEFNISDDLLKKMSASKDPKDKIIPYDVLLEDLSQAKRQLLELHNLVSSCKQN